MVTGWPAISCMRWPTARAMMSLGPPAGNGTISLIGLVGNSWAATAAGVSSMKAQARRNRLRMEILDVEIGMGGVCPQSPGWGNRIVLVADLLHPFHVLAVQGFVKRNMDHARAGPGAVPMLLVRWDPHRVAGADFLHLAAPGLDAAAAHDDVQGLAERMGVPGGACAGFETDAGGADARRLGRLHDRVLPHGSGEPVARSAARGIGAAARDLHHLVLPVLNACRA